MYVVLRLFDATGSVPFPRLCSLFSSSKPCRVEKGRANPLNPLWDPAREIPP